MKRPSFQFYPGDWMADLKLRRCSPAARGVWMDILCALHDSDDAYGLLKWPLKEIASTVGASLATVRELVEKGVLKGSDSALDEPLIYQPRSGRKLGAPVHVVNAQPGPIWFSKRMVIDDYVRTIRGESTRFGAEVGDAPDDAPSRAPKPPFGDGPSTPSPSSPSGKEPPTPAGGGNDLVGFARFWETWPSGSRKQGRAKCLEIWRRARLEPQADAIVAHVEAMKGTADWSKSGGAFVPMVSTYLNGRRWDGAEVDGHGVSEQFEGSL